MQSSHHIGRQPRRPQEIHERWIRLPPPATERQDQRFNRCVGMPIESAQINLPDLLAGRTNEARPRMAGGNRGSDPKVDHNSGPLARRPPQMVTTRRASRSAVSETTSRVRFSSMSGQRSLVPMCESCCAACIGQVVVDAAVVLCLPLPTTVPACGKPACSGRSGSRMEGQSEPSPMPTT